MRIAIRKGLDLPIDGQPVQRVEPGPRSRSVGLLGTDYPGLRLAPLVEPGERVRLGQPVLADRRRPELKLTAPGAGTVRSLHRGTRRALESLVIDLDGDAEERFASYPQERLAGLDRELVVANLLASGLWARALRARPFGRVPGPREVPRSLFVTAIDTEPLAPRPEPIVRARAREFAAGLAALGRLTEGPVFLCTAADAEVPRGDPARVSLAEFEGPHPAGLPGTHIHHLDPVGPGRSVWHVGYPEVIAIGELFLTGRVCVERVIALAGPAVREPRLLRTRLCASTEELVDGELAGRECRVVSGSLLAGRRAASHTAYLGCHHRQVCAIAELGERGRWLAPGLGGRVRSLLPRRSPAWCASLHGRRSAQLPQQAFDRVIPLDILAQPLLRALAVGDTDGAADLGALELVEEDLALCTFLCPAKQEYGPLLRATLAELERQG